MDLSALFNISYGLYIIATKDEQERNVGCVVNAVTQTSATPVSIAVCTNLDNYTTEAILKNGHFTISILSEQATMETIGAFGFWTSKEKNKFETIPFRLTESGLPYLQNQVCGYVECKVKQAVDCYTHKVILSDVTDAQHLAKEPPMTYDYYHKVIKGMVPKNAVTYVAAK